VTETLDLDKEIARLSGLAQDCSYGSFRWNLVWERIDRLLDERGKITVELKETMKVESDVNDSSL
jgi:hypothetical protein